MFETLKKIISFFGLFKKDSKKENTTEKPAKKVDPKVLIPIAVGSAIIVAGTAFLVYKLVLKKKAELEAKEALEAKDAEDDEFFEGEDA